MIMTWANIIKNNNNKNKILNLNKESLKEIDKNEVSIKQIDEIDFDDYQIEINNEFDKQKSIAIFDKIFDELEEQKTYNYIALNLNCSDILVFFESFIDKEGSIKFKKDGQKYSSDNSDSEYEEYLEYY